jgi:hypothetical protein
MVEISLQELFNQIFAEELNPKKFSDWEEEEHPRGDNGKFAPKGGGGLQSSERYKFDELQADNPLAQGDKEYIATPLGINMGSTYEVLVRGGDSESDYTVKVDERQFKDIDEWTRDSDLVKQVRGIDKGFDISTYEGTRIGNVYHTMKEYIDTAPKYKGEISRRVEDKNGLYAKAIVGEEFQLSAMSSFSKKNGEYEPDGYNLKIIIEKNTQAVDIQGFSRFPKEKEVVVSRDVRYRIVKKEDDYFDNDIVSHAKHVSAIYLEEIGQEKSEKAVKGYPIGHISTRKDGKKYKKVAQGDWQLVKDDEIKMTDSDEFEDMTSEMMNELFDEPLTGKKEDKGNKDMKMSELISDLFSGDYTEIKEVEVLNNYPNSYGLQFSEQDLEDYAKWTNEVINKGLVKPNVKLSHSDQQLILRELYKMADVDIWEELPNLGLLSNFRRKGRRVVADIKQIPSKLKDLVFGGRLFTSLSPELVRNWRETGKNIIRAVALSNIPSMKHVVDVPMSQGLGYRGNLSLEDGGKFMGDNDKTINVEQIIEQKLEKNNEGLLTKFSEMIKSIGKKKEETPIVSKRADGDMIALSDVQSIVDNAVGTAVQKYEDQLNIVRLQLVEKDKAVAKLSESFKDTRLESKKSTADAICKEAGLDGVPPYVIKLFKPVLMSEQGDQVVMFSEKVDDKEIEIKKPISSFITDLFKNYPNKIKMTEQTRTSLSAQSDDETKKIADRTRELVAQGMTQHAALTQAGIEIRS